MNKEYWKNIFLYEFSLISLIIVSILYKNNFYLGNKQELNNKSQIKEIAKTDDYYLPQADSNKKDISVLIVDKKEIEIEQPEIKKINKQAIQIASANQHEEDTVNNFHKDSATVKNIEEKYKASIKKSYYTNITSYNSEAAQTDSSPCITASGMNVCTRNTEDIVATNDLPLHSKILIPEYFGERIFYVEDRMNSRYTGTGRVDIWMKSKDNSKKWGIRNTKIIVLK